MIVSLIRPFPISPPHDDQDLIKFSKVIFHCYFYYAFSLCWVEPRVLFMDYFVGFEFVWVRNFEVYLLLGGLSYQYPIKADPRMLSMGLVDSGWGFAWFLINL